MLSKMIFSGEKPKWLAYKCSVWVNAVQAQLRSGFIKAWSVTGCEVKQSHALPSSVEADKVLPQILESGSAACCSHEGTQNVISGLGINKSNLQPAPCPD